MVCVKAKLRSVVARPVKCVVFMYKNPIHYSIWCFKEYFIRDKEARHHKQYKDLVHSAPEKLSPASAAKKTVNSGCDTEPANSSKLERCVIGY